MRSYCPAHGVIARRPCAACLRVREARRGTPQDRGYGDRHRQARAMLGELLPAPCGYAASDPLCPRTLIMPCSRWDAAHVMDGDPEAGYMPAHPACNQRAKRGRGAVENSQRSGAIPAPSFPREKRPAVKT